MARKQKLNPLDASWLMVESTETPMHVGSLTIFSLPKGAPESFLRDLVAQLRAQKEFAPPFNLKLASAALKGVLPAWVEDHRIDLDYHLRHSALPAPGGERELGVLVSRLHSHPLDFNRPLWECHIIEGLENKRFAMYMKMHHSQIDGVGGMRMLQKMLTLDPAETERPAPWAIGRGSGGPRPARERSPLAQRLAELARSQAETLPSVARALGEVVRESLRSSDSAKAMPYAAPRSLLNNKISGQRRFATQYYELERIKKVAKAAEVTVNDVFLELCSGSLRRYLEEIQALPEAPLTAGVPVSVRPADDADSGNAISFIIANLNTHLNDPLARLQAIKESTTLAKDKLQSLPKAGITSYTMIFMAPYILQLLTGMARTRAMFNVTISNVPGPAEYLYFNGARLEQMYPISLLSHGQALNITVVSYAGQFNVGFTGCRDTLPHMQRLATYMGEELELLESALVNKGRRKK